MMENVSLLPGLFPVFERREKTVGKRKCDKCGHTIRLAPEEGIDVRLTVDMIKLSNAEPEAIIILASNDSDFIPVVDYLSSLGRRVVHLRPKEGNRELSRHCWANMSLEDLNTKAFPVLSKRTLFKSIDIKGAGKIEKTLIERGKEFDTIEYDRLNEYEMWRIFYDNQRYIENFDSGKFEKGNTPSFSGINDALAYAKAFPDSIAKEFYLDNGRISNEHAFERLK